MQEADHRSQNPYTALEGYTVFDASGAEVGEIDETVYDATSAVLKYVSVDGHTVPADRIEVDPKAESVRAPYDRQTIRGAPALRDPSGEFDRSLRAHYGERGV